MILSWDPTLVGEEQSILYKGVETPRTQRRFKNLEENPERKKRGQYLLAVGLGYNKSPKRTIYVTVNLGCYIWTCGGWLVEVNHSTAILLASSKNLLSLDLPWGRKLTIEALKCSNSFGCFQVCLSVSNLFTCANFEKIKKKLIGCFCPLFELVYELNNECKGGFFWQKHCKEYVLYKNGRILLLHPKFHCTHHFL